MTEQLTTGVLETHPDLKLSPPPRSRALAIAALVVSGVVFAVISAVSLAVVLNANSVADANQPLIIVLGLVAFVCSLVPLIFAVRAFLKSLTAARLVRKTHVLQARQEASTAREQALIAMGLSAALIVIAAFIVLLFMNNASVQKTFLRWDIISDTLGAVTKAFGMNIFIAVVAEIIVLVFGLVLAVARMLPGKAGAPIRALAIAYIDVMRAVPAIIVIYLVGFGLPLAGIPVFKDLSPTWFAIIALALTYSAYVAETYRSGIESIHKSQVSAARSLGFSFAQTMRLVVLPQAVRLVIPPLLTMFIGLQKDTALVNVIGAMDAFNQAKYVSATVYNLSAVTVVAILFVIVTIPQTRLVDWWLERSKKQRGGV